jgi:ribosomal protein L37E
MTQQPSSYESMNEHQLIAIAESQKRTINALQNENHWLQDVIFNPSFNEVDMRLLVNNTPREIRMGLTSADAIPEKKIFFPAQAEKAHCSPKIASQHLRILAQKTGAFAYHIERDEETGNTISFLQPLPPAETPATLHIDRKAHGGSAWENGKRVKRCRDCGSANLVEVKQIICADCGSPQSEQTRKPVNATPDSHLDTDPDEATEADPENETEALPLDAQADSQDDTRPTKISKLPPSQCTQGGPVAGGPSPSVAAAPPVPTQQTAASHELQTLPQWVVWRYGMKKNSKGKYDKLPYDAKLSAPRSPCDTTNAESWASFEQAFAKYQESQSWKGAPYSGVGFCFKEGGGLVGIDRDGSIESLLNSYGEQSVSGSGLHQFAHGQLPRNIKRTDLGIEMYDHDRFFTWTGDHLDSTPETIEDCQAELDVLFAEIAPKPVVPLVFPSRQFTCARSDEEILEKARNAKNGAKFDALWGGELSGYPSHSEADQALCRMLAYWADNDVSVIDRLFRRSGLYREKWERADYREKTLNGVLAKGINKKESVAVPGPDSDNFLCASQAGSCEDGASWSITSAHPEQREALAQREFETMQAARREIERIDAQRKIPQPPPKRATICCNAGWHWDGGQYVCEHCRGAS